VEVKKKEKKHQTNWVFVQLGRGGGTRRDSEYNKGSENRKVRQERKNIEERRLAGGTQRKGQLTGYKKGGGRQKERALTPSEKLQESGQKPQLSDKGENWGVLDLRGKAAKGLKGTVF